MLPTEVNKPSKEAKTDGRGVKAEQSCTTAPVLRGVHIKWLQLGRLKNDAILYPQSSRAVVLNLGVPILWESNSPFTGVEYQMSCISDIFNS